MYADLRNVPYRLTPAYKAAAAAARRHSAAQRKGANSRPNGFEAVGLPAYAAIR